jgi:hypothetical protein
MKHAIYGPNLASKEEAMHIHAASCKDTLRKLYEGHEPLVLETNSMKTIITTVYAPSDFEYDADTEWNDYAQDFKVYACCSKRLKSGQDDIQVEQEAPKPMDSENPRAQFEDGTESTSEPVAQPEPELELDEPILKTERKASPTYDEMAAHVKEFAAAHREDKLRQWHVIADEWSVADIKQELQSALTKIRSFGGARRHFDWMVRLDSDRPQPANWGGGTDELDKQINDDIEMEEAMDKELAANPFS